MDDSYCSVNIDNFITEDDPTNAIFIPHNDKSLMSSDWIVVDGNKLRYVHPSTRIFVIEFTGTVTSHQRDRSLNLSIFVGSRQREEKPIYIIDHPRIKTDARIRTICTVSDSEDVWLEIDQQVKKETVHIVGLLTCISVAKSVPITKGRKFW